MPSPIQGISSAELLTEAFNLQGKLGLALDEMVVPVTLIRDLSADSYGPLAMGTIALPAGGGGFRSMIELAIPVTAAQTAGVEFLLERVLVSSSAAILITLGQSPGLPLPTIVAANQTWLDAGKAGSPLASLNGRNNVGAIAATTSLVTSLPAGTTQEIKLGWRLRIGPTTTVTEGIMVRPSTDNVPITCTFFWRERLPR